MFVLLSQILSVLFGALAISKSYVDFRSRRESLPMFLLWSAIWFLVVLIALFPATVTELLTAGGGQAGIGTLLGMAIIVLLFLLYRVNVKIERLEQKFTTLVQELALREPPGPGR
jgi:hypothetical protein